MVLVNVNGRRGSGELNSGSSRAGLLLGLSVGLLGLGAQMYFDSRVLGGVADTMSEAVVAMEGAQNTALSLSEIIALNLMGGSVPPAASAATTESIPDTRLNLELHGIFASNGAALAGAVIAEAGGKSGFYRIGDDIAEGVSLHAVAADSVVLKRGAALETLRYAEQKPSAGTASQVASRRVRGDNVAGSEEAQPQAGEVRNTAENTQRATQLRERLQRLRQRTGE